MMARPWRGQRSERFYVEVMTEFGRHDGYLTPAVGGVITGTTNSQLARTLSSLVLRPGDWEYLDLDRARLRPVMVVDDVETPLGVFLVVTDVQHPTTRGTFLEVQCQDLNVDLGDPFATTMSLAKGGGIGTKIAEILDQANVYDRTVVAANPVTSAHLGKPVGSPRWDALDMLTTLAGLTSPWRDRFGTARVVRLPYVGVTKPAGKYEAGDSSPIAEGSVATTRDRWKVPNTWVVIGRSDDAIRYAGRYTLPSSHPLSASKRGRTVTAPAVEIAGIVTQADADARARDQAQLDLRVHRTVELEVRADSTLEPWDIRTYSGEDWLVDSWSHELRTGAPQRIKLRESVMPTEADVTSTLPNDGGGGGR